MRDCDQDAETVSVHHDFGIERDDVLLLRLQENASDPTLIHLPGLHGDWTMLGPFRQALAGRARFIETTYPRKPEWLLDDYAAAVESALLECGVTSGWILGESFSSQVAWSFLHRQQKARAAAIFDVKGLILVGGFIRHAWPWAVRIAHSASLRVPLNLLRPLCKLYARGAQKRYCDCPGVQRELDEFVVRRTNEPDRRAITSRYRLIEANDPASIARETTLPVFHLSGAWDPIVPWWQVRPWLRRYCPGYRDTRIIWSGGHNVLLSSPAKSADQILGWVNKTSSQ